MLVRTRRGSTKPSLALSLPLCVTLHCITRGSRARRQSHVIMAEDATDGAKVAGDRLDGAPLRVAAFQGAAVPGDPARNAACVAVWARHAATAHRCSLVVFPETFLPGYDVPPATWRRCALKAPKLRDATAALAAPMQTIRDAATDCGVYIGVGYSELAPAAEDGEGGAGAGELYNSFVLFAPTGEAVLNYRKCHLFGAEAEAFTRGGPGQLESGVELQPWGVWAAALICFDVEFPEPARSLALGRVRLLLVPTALTDRTEACVIPERVVPTRAAENHCAVVWSNLRSAPDPAHAADPAAPLSFCGRSCVVAPNGLVLARASELDDAARWGTGEAGSCGCSAADEPRGSSTARPREPEGFPDGELVFADIIPGDYAEFRSRNPYFEQRRPECYKLA